MKLYFAPMACSLASHIALRETNTAHELIRVDLRSKALADGNDFFAINPQGQVPTLVLDDGRVLTEGPAVLQYIADLAPDKKLAPAWGTFERYQLIQWLNFITTNLHKSIYWTMFSPDTPPEAKQNAIARAPKVYAALAQHLENRSYLVGSQFTVADAYLTWALALAPRASLALPPKLTTYFEVQAQRPSIAAAMQYESSLLAA